MLALSPATSGALGQGAHICGGAGRPSRYMRNRAAEKDNGLPSQP